MRDLSRVPDRESDEFPVEGPEFPPRQRPRLPTTLITSIFDQGRPDRLTIVAISMASRSPAIGSMYFLPGTLCISERWDPRRVFCRRSNAMRFEPCGRPPEQYCTDTSSRVTQFIASPRRCSDKLGTSQSFPRPSVLAIGNDPGVGVLAS